MFGSISKEGVLKNSLEEIYVQKQATNKFMIGNLISTETVSNAIKKELTKWQTTNKNCQ